MDCLEHAYLVAIAVGRLHRKSQESVGLASELIRIQCGLAFSRRYGQLASIGSVFA